MTFLIALISTILVYFIARSIFGAAHPGALEEAHEHIKQVLAELKKKPLKDLQALEQNPQKEVRRFRALEFAISVWAEKHCKEDKLGVIVEYRKRHWLGVSTVGARGFFVDSAGVKDMAEEDYWDYGY